MKPFGLESHYCDQRTTHRLLIEIKEILMSGFSDVQASVAGLVDAVNAAAAELAKLAAEVAAAAGAPSEADLEAVASAISAQSDALKAAVSAAEPAPVA